MVLNDSRQSQRILEMINDRKEGTGGWNAKSLY